MKSWTERLWETDEGVQLFQQERTILEATELICRVMEEQGVNRAELAKRLKKTKGYVSQVLDGHSNMTLRTLSDILTALGKMVQMEATSICRSATSTVDSASFAWFADETRNWSMPCEDAPVASSLCFA